MKKYQLEVCTNSVESYLAAQADRADRVRLCTGVPEGGTTPSYGKILAIRDMLTTTRLHVIIRPRGGGFLYSSIGMRTMLKDIEMARQLGTDGMIFGCLTAGGEINLPVMQELMKALQGLSVISHRAFDVCHDPEKVLEQTIELGCNRILASGQQATAELGIPLLKILQTQASGRATSLAGYDVSEKNIVRIVLETGIQEFRFSAWESIRGGMKYGNESVSMGGTIRIDEYERNVATAQRVIDTTQAIKG